MPTVVENEEKWSAETAAFGFSLPILPGQEVRRIGQAISMVGRTPGRARRVQEKVWIQRTPIGQAMIVYLETDNPQRTLREIADSQDGFVKQFRELILSAAPTLDLSKVQPLPNELLFS
jgi:hypothetical protein